MSPTTPETSPEALDPEQRARLESLLEDLAALRRDADPSVPAPDLPGDLLLRLVVEGSPYATLPTTFLARCGMRLESPESVPDEKLTETLWTVIWVLALLRLFLVSTDHLDDRELYTYLYEEALREPTAFMPGEENPPFYTLDPAADLEQVPPSVQDRDRFLP